MLDENALLREIDSDLLRYIITKNLAVGERIPPLNIVAKQLNISVSKLREQLEVARALGIVEVRPRTGIRYMGFAFAPAMRLSLFFALANERSLFDLYSNLRVHVEVAYWHEATERLTLEDKLELKGLVKRAWMKLEGQPIIIPHPEHRSFHMGIFRHLQQPFVKGILETYWEAYEAVELNRYADYSYLQKVWTYHEKIVDELLQNRHEQSLEAFIEHTRLLRHFDPHHAALLRLQEQSI